MAFGDFVVGKESIIEAKKLGLVAVELRAWVQISPSKIYPKQNTIMKGDLFYAKL